MKRRTRTYPRFHAKLLVPTGVACPQHMKASRQPRDSGLIVSPRHFPPVFAPTALPCDTREAAGYRGGEEITAAGRRPGSRDVVSCRQRCGGGAESIFVARSDDPLPSARSSVVAFVRRPLPPAHHHARAPRLSPGSTWLGTTIHPGLPYNPALVADGAQADGASKAASSANRLASSPGSYPAGRGLAGSAVAEARHATEKCDNVSSACSAGEGADAKPVPSLDARNTSRRSRERERISAAVGVHATAVAATAASLARAWPRSDRIGDASTPTAGGLCSPDGGSSPRPRALSEEREVKKPTPGRSQLSPAGSEDAEAEPQELVQVTEVGGVIDPTNGRQPGGVSMAGACAGVAGSRREFHAGTSAIAALDEAEKGSETSKGVTGVLPARKNRVRAMNKARRGPCMLTMSSREDGSTRYREGVWEVEVGGGLLYPGETRVLVC